MSYHGSQELGWMVIVHGVRDYDCLHDAIAYSRLTKTQKRRYREKLWRSRLVEATPKPSTIKVLATYTPEQILPLTGTNAPPMFLTIDTRPYRVNMSSLRYRTFSRSLRCSSCGIEGSEMRLELQRRSRNPHFNLYHVTETGRAILMTKDHVIPLSRGGENKLSNLTTMCSPCNNRKGNRMPEELNTSAPSSHAAA